MERLENDALHELLRMALDDECSPRFLSRKFSAEEWESLHSECLKQLVAGVVYRAISHLPRDMQPPLEIAFQWASEAETIKGQNKLLNAEAARLTDLFAAQGRKTAVLKGPANALLYPAPDLRQAGDIDLWVEGGRDSVVGLLKKMGYEDCDSDYSSSHHVHLYPVQNGISVEIHYQSTSGNWNPFTSARLIRFLDQEIQNVERVKEGFYVPSIKFALVMQLAHIQHHFIAGGIGFKQILDYYLLLKRSAESDRREIAPLLSRLGLLKVCRALMWVLDHVLGLDKSRMLCAPNEKYGRMMLTVVQNGGNFGRYAVDPVKDASMNFILRFIRKRWRNFQMFWFAPVEVLGHELAYWIMFAKSIPLRIKLRRWSLWDLYHPKM